MRITVAGPMTGILARLATTHAAGRCVGLQKEDKTVQVWCEQGERENPSPNRLGCTIPHVE
jgi:hypothetical protein